MNLSPQATSVVELIRTQCALHNVLFLAEETENVMLDDGFESSGFFGDYPDHDLFLRDGKTYKGVLGIATARPEAEWLPVLVHEYNHMLQWLENAHCWTWNEADSHGLGTDKITALFEWIAGERDLSGATLGVCVEAGMWVEADCEERTLKMLESWNYPIDLGVYRQKANAYILFYRIMEAHRAWYALERKPYMRPEVYELWTCNSISTSELLTYKLSPAQWDALRSCI